MRPQFLFAGLGVLFVACGSEQPTTPPAESAPLTIAHAGSGDVVTVQVSTEVPYLPTVVVTQNGAPRAGVTIQWKYGAHPDYPNNIPVGVIDPLTSVTGLDGKASTKWRLSSLVGPQNILAKLAGDTSDRVVVFAVNAVPGTPTHLVQYTGTEMIAPETSKSFPSLGVGLADDFGHYIWETKIKWTVVSGPVTMAAADDYKYWSPLISRAVSWTGGLGDAVVRAEAIGSGTTADFSLHVVPALSSISVRRGPPYLIRVKQASTFASPTLYSVQNGRSGTIADTIPVGAVVRFGDESRAFHLPFTLLGLPDFPAGRTIPSYGEIEVTFPTAGTFAYSFSGSTISKGTMVVQ